MIKKFFPYTFILLLIFTLTSCNNPTTSSEYDFVDLNEILTVKQNTNKISATFAKIGVDEVYVDRYENSKLYRVNTLRNFRFEGETINLKNYEVLLKDHFLALKNDLRYKIYLTKNNDVYLDTPYYKGLLKSKEFKIDKNVVALLLYLKELTTDAAEKVDIKVFEKNQSKAKTIMCSFWDTEHSVAFGASKSTAEARLLEGIASYDGYEDRGCTKIGGVDTSCGLDNHICVSTQSYCCP